MDEPYLPAKIIGIKPGAGYEGKVYDQYVSLELPDGKVLQVFDPLLLCKPELVGSMKKVVITASLVQIRKVPGPVFGVTPGGTDRTSGPEGGHGPLFLGKIEGKVERSRHLLVNIGYGQIYSDPHGCFDSFGVGDFVEIYAARTDLDNILD